MNYHKLAFSAIAKALQEEKGSRRNYDQVEKNSETEGLTENEIDFIGRQDSFYMASIGENRYPYIQHRGGPEGFIKVLDAKTIGVVDFSGNKQYISVGNILANPRVSLIMVSYPHKARLKLYADVKVVRLEENKDLFDLLDPKEYKHKPERMFVFEIKAYDWNCPQHITQRFSLAQVETAFDSQVAYIKRLEEEIKMLKLKH